MSATKEIPSHLGGLPNKFSGWIGEIVIWFFVNILCGFAIVVAALAIWLEMGSENISHGLAYTAIAKSICLSVLAWSTALMLSSADIPNLFKYFPSIGWIKTVLLIATILAAIMSVVFLISDPPDWSIYISRPERNDRLLYATTWISVTCILLGICWTIVQKKSRYLDMQLLDQGWHDQYDEKLHQLAEKSRTETKAGSMKLK